MNRSTFSEHMCSAVIRYLSCFCESLDCNVSIHQPLALYREEMLGFGLLLNTDRAIPTVILSAGWPKHS